MNIPDLPPDLSFPKLGTSPEDQEFAFEVKRNRCLAPTLPCSS